MLMSMRVKVGPVRRSARQRPAAKTFSEMVLVRSMMEEWTLVTMPPARVVLASVVLEEGAEVVVGGGQGGEVASGASRLLAEVDRAHAEELVKKVLLGVAAGRS